MPEERPRVDTSYQTPLPGEVVWNKKEKAWQSTNAYWERMQDYEKANGITPDMLSGGVTWPTPTSRDGKGKDAPGRGGGQSLCEAVRDVSDTKSRRTGRGKQQQEGGEEAGDVAHGKRVKKFPTPRANDGQKRGKISDDPRNGLPGVIENEET